MLGLPPSLFISRVITLVIALSVHEFMHAFTADRFGDDTPRQYGRLTLNPLAHFEMWGTLMLLFAGFGWGRPVPVNHYALERRSRAAPMLVAVAGPISNFMLALLASLPIRFNILPETWMTFNGIFPEPGDLFGTFIIINLSLALFNLIPLPPLDGSYLADYLFPPQWRGVLDRIRPYGQVILMLLFISPNFLPFDILGFLIGLPMQALLKLMFFGV